jgi:plastocyanin
MQIFGLTAANARPNRRPARSRTATRLLAVSALLASTLVALAAPKPAAAASSEGSFFPLPPARILDTRVGIGGAATPVGPNQVRNFTVTNQGGVPATDVSAVVLNMTVVAPTATSYMTVWPTNEPMPTASNLNYVAGQTVPNLVKAKVGAGGQVSVFNAFGTVHVLADVAGWYKTGAEATEGSRYISVSPARILDTRTGNGAPLAPVGPNQSVDVQVTGRGGVPVNGVSAVALNVTAVSPTATSYLTAWPAGEQRPNASNLNYVAGDVVPNLVIVKVGTNGRVSLYNESGSLNVISDVVGWYSAPAGPGAPFVPLNPSRILDTRTGNGAPLSPMGEGQTLNLQVLDRGGVPASGVTAVVLNVTAVNPTSPSYLTAWPSGEARPNASNLNYKPGQVVPNLVVVKVGAGGFVNLFNELGQVDVIADVVGWYGLLVPSGVEVDRTISVTITHPHLYTPDTVVAPAGSRVTMTFTNPTDEVHTWTSPPVGVDRAVDGLSASTFTFTMPFAQTRFVCLIHQAEGMIGTLIPS